MREASRMRSHTRENILLSSQRTTFIGLVGGDALSGSARFASNLGSLRPICPLFFSLSTYMSSRFTLTCFPSGLR